MGMACAGGGQGASGAEDFEPICRVCRGSPEGRGRAEARTEKKGANPPCTDDPPLGERIPIQKKPLPLSHGKRPFYIENESQRLLHLRN